MSLKQNLTENQLKNVMNYQKFDDQIIYYSIVGKLNNMGIFNNDRMIFLNQKLGELYYTDIFKAPFNTKEKVPIPKKNKDVINVRFGSVFTHPLDSNDIKVEYRKVDQSTKDKAVAATWQFTFANKVLAKEWYEKIKQIQARNFTEAIGVGQDKIKNQNKSFIHDTINFMIIPQQREPKNTDYGEEYARNIYNSSLDRQKQRQQAQSRIRKQKQREKQLQQERSRISNNQNEKYGNSRISNLNQSIIRNSLPENSRLSKPANYQQQESGYMRGSNIRKSNANDQSLQNDWNFVFLKKPHQQTILEFQQYAVKAFYGIYDQERRNTTGDLRKYQSKGLYIQVADMFSTTARQMKQQFRNYHYIVQATKDIFKIGTPLSCFIELEGLAALVKAPIHSKGRLIEATSDVLQGLKDLQKFTKIKNQIFSRYNNCKLYDMSEVYGESQQLNQKSFAPIIFVDQLLEYLPYVPQNQNTSGLTVRSEFILDNVNFVMTGGTIQQSTKGVSSPQSQVLKKTVALVQNIAQFLSNQEFLFANILELKNFLHINGLNMKYLPHIYKQVSNKSVKRYIHTCMVAKVVKDDIVQSFCILNKQEKRKQPLHQITEELIKVLIQGGSNASSERWKSIAMEFKKKFGITLNSHEIVPGFFLNSLMCLIKGKYNVKKLDQQKVIFKEQGIVSSGFVERLLPKVKSYWRFTSKISDQINEVCKDTSANPTKQDFSGIVNALGLRQKSIPDFLYLNETDRRVAQYISAFIRPEGMDTSSASGIQGFRHLKKQIYSKVNEQPPTEHSIMITKMYLQYATQGNKVNEFKKQISEALRILDYWLDQTHPYHCDFYDCLADYYVSIGNLDQSIYYAKESLVICVKSGTRTAKLMGQKCYSLADKQLKAGYKVEAMENFTKAKSNMEQQDTPSEYYPLVLMNLALLNLNAGNINKCIQFSVLSEKNFRSGRNRQSERESIKTYEILGRAYEISQMKNQMREMALRVAQKFNRTKSAVIFQQMLRICTTGAIGKLPLQKSQILLKCLQKIVSGDNEQSMRDPEKCIDYLMKEAESYTVMERFIHKVENVERIWNEINSKRALSNQSRQFLNTLGHLSGAIGEQFIVGLVQQKEYQ